MAASFWYKMCVLCQLYLLLMVMSASGMPGQKRHQVCMDVEDSGCSSENIKQGRPGKSGAPGQKGSSGPVGPPGEPGRDGAPAAVDYSRIEKYIEEKIALETNRLLERSFELQGKSLQTLQNGKSNKYVLHYDLELASAGYVDGNVCILSVNGKQYQKVSRGMCVVIYDARNQKYLVETFDTHGMESEVKRMVAFLKAAPFQSIIMMAVRDSSNGEKFDDTDVAYLNSLGFGGKDCPVRLGVRDALAFAAVKTRSLPDRWMSCNYKPVNNGKVSFKMRAKLAFTKVLDMCADRNLPRTWDQIEIFQQADISCYFPTFGYPADVDIIYTIYGDDSKRLRVEFQHFDIEGSDCRYDHLKIIDGNDSSARPLRELCGHSIPAPLETTSNAVTLFFKTDDSIQKAGFMLSVKEI